MSESIEYLLHTLKDTTPVIIKEIWSSDNEEQNNYSATYEFNYNEVKEAFNNNRPIIWKIISEDSIYQHFPEQIFMDDSIITIQKKEGQTFFLYPDNTIKIRIG